MLACNTCLHVACTTLTMYVSHERALVRMQASADKVSCDKTLAEQAATACRASSRRGREGSDHRWRHVSRDTAACLVMVAVVFDRCQSFPVDSCSACGRVDWQHFVQSDCFATESRQDKYSYRLYSKHNLFWSGTRWRIITLFCMLHKIFICSMQQDNPVSRIKPHVPPDCVWKILQCWPQLQPCKRRIVYHACWLQPLHQRSTCPKEACRLAMPAACMLDRNNVEIEILNPKICKFAGVAQYWTTQACKTKCQIFLYFVAD